MPLELNYLRKSFITEQDIRNIDLVWFGLSISSITAQLYCHIQYWFEHEKSQWLSDEESYFAVQKTKTKAIACQLCLVFPFPVRRTCLLPRTILIGTWDERKGLMEKAILPPNTIDIWRVCGNVFEHLNIQHLFCHTSWLIETLWNQGHYWNGFFEMRLRVQKLWPPIEFKYWLRCSIACFSKGNMHTKNETMSCDIFNICFLHLLLYPLTAHVWPRLNIRCYIVPEFHLTHKSYECSWIYEFGFQKF